MASRKHIKNYFKARAMLRAYYEKEFERARNALKKAEKTYGNKECWDEQCKCYRYPGDDCRVCTDSDVKDAKHYLEVTLPKCKKSDEDRLEAADKAGKLVELEINVEWSRDCECKCLSPRAEVWLTREDEQYGTAVIRNRGDKASGAGYDKRSAAAMDALLFEIRKRDGERERAAKISARASLDRFVIESGEPMWKEYGIYRRPFPHLHFGSAGMSCFTRLFKRIGCRHGDAATKEYVSDYHEPEKGTDTYHVIRKDRI